MTPRGKIDAAVDYLLQSGVAWQTAAPPHYRLMWAMGFTFPPLLFQSFVGALVVNGLFFGVIFAGVAWVGFRPIPGEEIQLMLTLAPIGGLLVGLICGLIARFHAWRLGLPRWADFRPDVPHEETDGDW